MAELKLNQVETTDGKIVEIREINGADEMVVGAYLGDAMEANAGSAIMFQNCLIAQAIDNIDGTPRPTLRSFEDYRDFLAQFKGKSWARIKNKFNELNGDDGEGNASGAKSKA